MARALSDGGSTAAVFGWRGESSWRCDREEPLEVRTLVSQFAGCAAGGVQHGEPNSCLGLKCFPQNAVFEENFELYLTNLRECRFAEMI